MPTPKPALVPARYVGDAPVRLAPRPGGYRDATGQPLTTLLLHPGDTLMVPEPELRGQTFLVDPSGVVAEAEWLGVGTVLLTDHAGLAREDVVGLRFHYPRNPQGTGPVRQYDFHDGRADFQELHAPWTPPGVVVVETTADIADAAPDAAPARRSRKADAAASTDVPVDESASTPAQGE